jgi:hypothetical protein
MIRIPPEVAAGYTAARSARFEHGESGAPGAQKPRKPTAAAWKVGEPPTTTTQADETAAHIELVKGQIEVLRDRCAKAPSSARNQLVQDFKALNEYLDALEGLMWEYRG